MASLVVTNLQYSTQIHSSLSLSLSHHFSVIIL